MSASIVSILMVLVMALSGMGGALSGTDAAEPVSVEVGLELQGDISPLASGMDGEMVSLVQKLANALSFRIGTDGSVSRLEILIDGAPIASAAVKDGEDAYEAVSTLFPTSLLTVKKETLDSMMQGTASSLGASAGLSGDAASGLSAESLSQIDFAALGETVKAAFEETLDVFRGKYSETEAGSFVIGDVEYTGKQTCDVTMKEAAEIVLNAAKKLLSDESVAPVVSLLGEDFSVESLDEALESLQSNDEADMPALSVVRYSNEAGNVLNEISMDKDDQFIRILNAISEEASSYTLSVSMDEATQMEGTLLISADQSLFDLDADVTSDGLSVNVKANLAIGETETAASLLATVPFPGAAEPIALGINGKYSHEAPAFEAAEGLETVALEDLMQDESLSQTFSTKLTLGAMQVVMKLAQQYPEIQTLMYPAESSPAEEEVPAEEPAVESEDPAA